MIPATTIKLIGLILVILTITSFASAQTLVCVETKNPTAAPVCNTTALQSTLPAKACAVEPFSQYTNDFAIYCADYIYNIWLGICPKQNHDVQGFCGGQGINNLTCFLTPCTTDADCSQPTPSENVPYYSNPPTSPQIGCYDCCQVCFEDTDCDIKVTQGDYAPQGSTNCISCSTTPICVNGYVESTGYCNCYSGFMNDPLTPKSECSAPPSNATCLPLSKATPMENNVFPSISNLRAQRNTVSMSITSSFVAGRRTLIEFPNSECNLISSPNFYNKTNNGCSDEYLLEIPFADCGFTMTSETEYDIYRGEMHVKHIDIVKVDDTDIERVVDTPFAIAIRLPKNLAVQTSVEIATPVATAVKAAFVGQTVDVATQTGQLTFLTSAPASLTILSGRIVYKPPGVNAALRFIDQNCNANSTAGFCQQRLAIDLSILACEISGIYTMEVQVGCSDQQNCPIGFNASVNVTLVASITAQHTCGEAFVDVGLSGSLQAFNDESFTSQALSFNFGKPAYFLINAYADREVIIAGVTLDGVFYYGPNVPGNFLLTNGTVSELGSQNNFNWGQHSNSQAWFSLAVTVSKPDSNENTLFKLNNDESGVYNFMALVSVEWIENGASVKKRVVLESKSFNQGSQFSAQVQIANTKQDDAMSMSSIVAASSSILFASVFVSLF